MAQFDVHRLGAGLILDCQTDLLAHIESRFVVPLVPSKFATITSRRLNPTFEIEGEVHIMVTQAASAVRRSELGKVVVSLADRSFEITGAIDVLTDGV